MFNSQYSILLTQVMPNDYFKFKQFTIHQDKCAMKVCTDACMLGAWTASKMDGSGINNILDIGCGTGLLSLMLSQKINASIDAVEIDPDAAKQAGENISASPWASNIRVIPASLQEFMPLKKYDLIICNPPFYENDLRSVHENKNFARHDTGLKLDMLAFYVKSLLNDEGRFVLLLPIRRTVQFEKIAEEHGLFPKEKLLVRQSPRHDPFRSIIMFGKKETGNATTNEMTIHTDERQYTDDFELLLKDYYLRL